MTSVRALIGLPVLLNSRTIGRVSSVALDAALRKLLGLYVHCGLCGGRLISETDIRLIGEVSVLVDNTGKRAKPESVPLRKVLTRDGAHYGAVTGALIAECTRDVTALEVSCGFFADLQHGREWLYRYAVQTPSGDVLSLEDNEEGGDSE